MTASGSTTTMGSHQNGMPLMKKVLQADGSYKWVSLDSQGQAIDNRSQDEKVADNIEKYLNNHGINRSNSNWSNYVKMAIQQYRNGTLVF